MHPSIHTSPSLPSPSFLSPSLRPMMPIQEAKREQKKDVIREYNKRVEHTKLLFAEEGLNAEVYYKNIRELFSLIL